MTRICCPEPDADQRVVNEDQGFVERRAEHIRELERRRASAAFAAVDRDEIGGDAGLDHGLADGQKLAALAQAQLEADGLAT